MSITSRHSVSSSGCVANVVISPQRFCRRKFRHAKRPRPPCLCRLVAATLFGGDQPVVTVPAPSPQVPVTVYPPLFPEFHVFPVDHVPVPLPIAIPQFLCISHSFSAAAAAIFASTATLQLPLSTRYVGGDENGRDSREVTNLSLSRRFLRG